MSKAKNSNWCGDSKVGAAISTDIVFRGVVRPKFGYNYVIFMLYGSVVSRVLRYINYRLPHLCSIQD